MEVTTDERNVESIDGQFGASTCCIRASLDIAIIQLPVKFVGLKKVIVGGFSIPYSA